jgi:CrcB protein
MKVLLNCVAIGSAGFVGALCRWGAANLSARWFGTAFPVGTLIINVTGSFILGAFLGWAGRTVISDTLRLAVATGFLGAYTTFSTFAYETDALVREGAVLKGTANLVLSVALGLVAVRLGIILSQRI